MPTVEHFLEGLQDFQHVAISVSDVDRSLAFYRDLLGFPVLGRLYYTNEIGLVIDFLDIGKNAILEIFSFREAPTKPSEFLPDDRQLGMRHIAFRVGDVDAVTARLKAAGVEFTLEPVDAVGGVRIAFFKDPDGTLLEITQGNLDYHVWGQPPIPVPMPPAGAPAGSDFTYEHVAITVSDMQKALDFYTGVLGLPLLGELHFGDERGFRIAYLQFGNAFLELFAFDAPTIPHTWNPDETVLGIKHLGLLVDDVDAVLARLLDRGVRVIYPPNDAHGGVRTCFFADPDGNALELIDGTCEYDA